MQKSFQRDPNGPQTPNPLYISILFSALFPLKTHLATNSFWFWLSLAISREPRTEYREPSQHHRYHQPVVRV